MSADTSVPHPQVSGFGPSDAALFATLIREAPIGFAFFDTELRCRRVNQTLAGLAGRQAGEIIDRRPAEFLAETAAEPVQAVLRRVLAEDHAVLDTDLSLDMGGADGPRLWASSWFPSHGPDGAAVGVALICVDVTDRRRAEDAVRRTGERYRSLVVASSQIVWVTDPQGRIAEDATEWRAITGQSFDDYEVGGWLAVVHPEDRGRIEDAWQQCLADPQQHFETSYRIRTRSGTYRYYEVRAVPIWRGERVAEWVGANTDVTGQREAEEMRGRLTEQLSAAALRTARLQQATSMLAEALTVSQVVQVITEVGRSAIGADRSAVALLDDDKVWLRIIAPGPLQPAAQAPAPVQIEVGYSAPDGEFEPRDTFQVSEPTVMSHAVRESKPFLAQNPDDLRIQLGRGARGEIDAFLRNTEERAWVGLPLLAAGTSIGALRFAFTRPREVTDEERVFLEALAGQCTMAVERALLFEREHKTAETLQLSLLPGKLPQVPTLLLAARYHPATRHVQVGGDWYDAFSLPDDRMAIVVGDVMGKGVGAAATMGRIRNALRALALNDPRPAAVLSGLDRLFSATEEAEQFTTVAYAVIDPETGAGVLSNAGHPPPLIVGRDGPASLSTAEPGTPLGWPSHRQQTSFSLPAGNTMVFYSDGLVENRRRGVDVGLDELVGVAADATPEVVGDPEILVDYLVDRMLAGYEQDDDVTVLALHVPPRATP